MWQIQASPSMGYCIYHIDLAQPVPKSSRKKPVRPPRLAQHPITLVTLDDEKETPPNLNPINPIHPMVGNKRKRGDATTEKMSSLADLVLSPDITDGRNTPPFLSTPTWSAHSAAASNSLHLQRRHSNYHIQDEENFCPGILLLHKVETVLCQIIRERTIQNVLLYGLHAISSLISYGTIW